jgi:ketosteroid isomerase-like protein
MAELLPGLDAALQALNRGDVEPAVALLDESVQWRGRPDGHLWWKHTPSCSGPDEARVNLKRQAAKGAQRRFELQQVEQVGQRLVIGGRWRTDGGSQEQAGRFFQVLTVRDGRIVGIEGCTSRRSAMAAARR